MNAIWDSDQTLLLDLNIFKDNTHDLDFAFNSQGTTPLMLACAIGKPLIVELLLRNPEINRAMTDNFGNNCMYYATMHGHLSVL